MDRKKLFFLELGVLILSLVFSFLFHMLYDLLDQNAVVGFIAPVNESVWEHGKLIFFLFSF